MINYAVFNLAVILFLAETGESAVNYKSNVARCGCFPMCDKKYTDKEKASTETQLTVSACRQGCRYYHVMARLPHKIAPITSSEVGDGYCADSCAGTFPFSAMEKQACLDGCRNGCENYGIGQPPRVRLTIYVEDELPDGAEGDQSVSDPAFRQQFETHIIALPGEKTKIPASYFTNLPISKDQDSKCCKPKLCDWIIKETSLFIDFFLIMSGIGLLLLMSKCRKRSQLLDYERGEYDTLPDSIDVYLKQDRNSNTKQII